MKDLHDLQRIDAIMEAGASAFGSPNGGVGLGDDRLPEEKRGELDKIARNFEASHSVDELCYLSGALWTAAERRAGRG